MKPTYQEKNFLDYLFGGFRSTLERPSLILQWCWAQGQKLRTTYGANSHTMILQYKNDFIIIRKLLDLYDRSDPKISSNCPLSLFKIWVILLFLEVTQWLFFMNWTWSVFLTFFVTIWFVSILPVPSPPHTYTALACTLDTFFAFVVSRFSTSNYSDNN